MWLLKAIKNLIFGTLFCLSPVSAVIALGWLMRYMRLVALDRLEDNPSDERVGWIMGPKGNGFLWRSVGGFWQNLTVGIGGGISLLLATLPFTGLWILSWWAGWENSFNKGYEQAWVGPLVGFTGLGIGLWVMAHLQIGLAHQAVQNRWFALFELKRVRQLVGLAGWRYVVLALVTVLLALPIFAARGLPVFVEGIIPGFADLSQKKIEELQTFILVAKAAYVFTALVFLRSWSARIYAYAVTRAEHPLPDAEVVKTKKANWFLRTPHLALLLIIWFAFAFLILAGQFLNNSWVFWVNHPFLVLPWLP